MRVVTQEVLEMGHRVLHEGKVFELKGDGWTQEKLKAATDEVFVIDHRVGCTRTFPARELMWLKEGELERKPQKA